MEISLDDYLGQRGLRSPISGYMDDKWRNMRLTARGQKRFEKEAEAAIIEYSKLRKVDENWRTDTGRSRRFLGYPFRETACDFVRMVL